MRSRLLTAGITGLLCGAAGIIAGIGLAGSGVPGWVKRQAFGPGEIAEPARGDYERQRAVYHINGGPGLTGRAYLSPLNSIRNHLFAVGRDKVEIVVALHGDGIELLRGAEFDEATRALVDELREGGVRFLACRNTLKSKGLAAADLYGLRDSDVVASGVAEIGRLQQQGYAYIKP